MTRLKNSTCRQLAKDKQKSIEAPAWLRAAGCLCALTGVFAPPGTAQQLAQQPIPAQIPPQFQGMMPAPALKPTSQAKTQTHAPFPNADGLSFGDRLSHLEAANGLGASSPDSSILDRISRLEQKVFGQVRPGSIVDRLKALETTRPAQGQQGQPWQAPQQSQQFQAQQSQQFQAQQSQQFQPQQSQPFQPQQSQQSQQFQPQQGQWAPQQSSPWQPPAQSFQTQPAQPFQPQAQQFQPAQNLQSTTPAQTGQPSVTAQQAPGGQRPTMADIIKGSHVASIVTTSNLYPVSFYHVPKAGDDSLDNSDYLDQVMAESKNKVLKFQKFPITIFITPIQEPGFAKAIREAFDDWDVHTKGMVKFVEVKNENDARIIVVWSHLGIKSGTDCSLGAHTLTKWKSRGPGKLAFIPVGAIPIPLYIPAMGPKYSVPPQVIEVNLDVLYGHEAEIRNLLLKNIATHELGHALGMLGHSPTEGDMMYSVTDEHSRLSQRDINTVTKLYQRKADIPL
jgi:predicted Zn-dependent protease